jgi:hypothetical protein
MCYQEALSSYFKSLFRCKHMIQNYLNTSYDHTIDGDMLSKGTSVLLLIIIQRYLRTTYDHNLSRDILPKVTCILLILIN